MTSTDLAFNSTYKEVTDATEQYIRQLLLVDIAIKPDEIRIRHDMAKGAITAWFEIATPLVEAETHMSEQDHLGELVSELAAAMPVLG